MTAQAEAKTSPIWEVDVVPRRAGSRSNITSIEREEPAALSSNIPTPKLRLQIHDLRHSACTSFLSLIPDPASALQTALLAIVKYLYTPSTRASAEVRLDEHTSNGFILPNQNQRLFFTPSIPATRSVTLILRDFDGVAYTTGTELDDDHKEIHLSLSYIRTVCANNASPISELAGVLTHELVHCYQHTAPPISTSSSTARNVNEDSIHRPPSGLIEGIADFVRLKAGLEPGHWKRPSSGKDRAPRWDQGYQHTAFFLTWLEDVRAGTGAVGMLNDRLLRLGYVGEAGEEGQSQNKPQGQVPCGDAFLGEESFWRGLFGVGVGELWDEYGRYLDGLENHDRA